MMIKVKNKLPNLGSRINLLTVFILSIGILGGCATTTKSDVSDKQAYEAKMRKNQLDFETAMQKEMQEFKGASDRLTAFRNSETNGDRVSILENIALLEFELTTVKENPKELVEKLIGLEVTDRIVKVNRKKGVNKVEIQSAQEIIAINNDKYPQYLEDTFLVYGKELRPNEKQRHKIVQEQLQKSGFTLEEIQRIANLTQPAR